MATGPTRSARTVVITDVASGAPGAANVAGPSQLGSSHPRCSRPVSSTVTVGPSGVLTVCASIDGTLPMVEC